jgi:hypothetical protein
MLRLCIILLRLHILTGTHMEKVRKKIISAAWYPVTIMRIDARVLPT